VDAFEIGVLLAVATAVVACCLAARASAGRRLGEMGGRRAAGRPAASELARRDEEDLQEMLEATNARRRARGLPERTLADAIREFGDE
jgi:hypothetical protein